MSRQCIAEYRGERCSREAAVSPMGTVHNYCERCESRLLAAAWRPVRWVDRARTETLPPLVIDGTPVDAGAATPRADSGVLEGVA